MAGGLEIPWRERVFVVKSFQMAKVQGEAAVTAPGAKIPATQTLNSGAADPESRRLAWINRGMLAGALLAALLVYHTCLNAGWFYDDQDYVLLDPRVGNLKLFMPGSWSQPPPSLDELGQNLMLPGYDKPVIADRYLWHLNFALEREFVERFKREVKVMSSLRHPNTVRIITDGEMEDSSLYIVMELLNGRGLDHALKHDGPWPLDRARPYIVAP